MGFLRRTRSASPPATDPGIAPSPRGASSTPGTDAAPQDDTAGAPVDRTSATDGSAVPVRSLADLPALMRELESFGHDIRFSDQLGDTEIPDELSRIAFRILEAGVTIIGRRFPDGQQLHIRVRADDDELLVSIQSTGLDGLGQQGLVPESDRAVVRRRVEAIGGRLTLRRTPSGNWIGVVRLPLSGWDDARPPAH